MSDGLSTAVSIASPFISALVETWIKPKLKEFVDKSSLDRKIYDHTFSNKFADYLEITYERYSYIPTIVFQNQAKKLADLYIPLTIRSTSAQSNDEYQVTDYDEDFISKYKKILITDSAGMGKSTLLKKLFLSCMEKQAGIPIFIELRKLNSHNTIIDVIVNELNTIDKTVEVEFVLSLIARGDFVFFFDGYDEIALSDKSEVTKNIQTFISKSSKNHFILSSRPESAISSFVDFYEFSINPLEKEEAFNLLRKYDSNGEISDKLITKLSEKDVFSSVQEFLSNPLMASLLFKGYDYKAIIPYKKHIFYRQVYDALFEGHDLTKGDAFVHEKNSSLDIEEFHQVLRAFGYVTLKADKIEYDKDELLGHIRNAKSLTIGLEFKENNILQDLLSTVPLFYREGNYYRWKHKSIQEYFSAQFICTDSKSKQEIILMNMYNSQNLSKYVNVLDLCYDIDYKTFRKTILRDIIRKFIAHYDSHYCHPYFARFDNDVVSTRKSLSFAMNVIIWNRKDYLDTTFENTRTQRKRQDIIRQKYGISFDDDWMAVFTPDEDYAILFYFTREIMVLNMLKRKKDKAVLQQNEVRGYKFNCKIDDFIVINDDPNSIVNCEELFSCVNTIMRCFDSAELSIDECRRMIVEIEKEIQFEAENSEFFLF